MLNIVNPRKKKKRLSWITTVILVILIIYTISLLWPLIWALFTTFRPTNQFKDFSIWSLFDYAYVKTIPFKITFENYKTAFILFDRVYPESKISAFVSMFFNSIVYSVGCAITSTITPCIVAYLSARYPYKLGKVAYLIVIITMALPIVGSLPSEIQMATALGIKDTFYGLWIMKANFLGVYFLVFYAQFKTIPASYSEAAKIDGASDFRIMWEIIMPLAVSTILTVLLLNFITFWNDYQSPMIYWESHPVIAYGTYKINTSKLDNLYDTANLKIVASMLVALPILILFLACHKKMMVNVSVGGIKE